MCWPRGLAAAAAAAVYWLRHTVLPKLPPWLARLARASYAALPVGTSLVLQLVLGGLVATLAGLLLRPKVLRAGAKNVLPFLAVAGSTLLAMLVPVAVGAVLTMLGMLSFGPMVATYMAGHWFQLPVKARILLAVAIPLSTAASIATFYEAGQSKSFRGSLLGLLRKAVQSLRVWMVFALPFYSVFVIIVVGMFSLVWSMSIGAFIFMQGEVFADWSGGARRRWPAVLQLCETLFAGAVFDYFPISVRLAAGTRLAGARSRAATGQSSPSPLSTAHKYLFCYHPHGVYAFGLFALLFGRRSGFHSLFKQQTTPVMTCDDGDGTGRGNAAAAARPRARRHQTVRVVGSRGARSRSPSPQAEAARHEREATTDSSAWAGSGGPPCHRGILIGVANALLHVPVVSSFFAWFGFVAASYGSLREACMSEYNVAVVPGERYS